MHTNYYPFSIYVLVLFIHSFIHFNSGSKAHKHTDNRQTDRQTRAKTQENIYRPKNYKQRIDRDKLHNRVLNRDLGKLTKMHNDMINT